MRMKAILLTYSQVKSKTVEKVLLVFLLLMNLFFYNRRHQSEL